MPPRRELLDLNEAIREVIALTQTDLQRNGVKLQTRLADDLPLVPETGDDLLPGGPDRLARWRSIWNDLRY